MSKKCIIANTLGLLNMMEKLIQIIIELMPLFQILFLEMTGVYYIKIQWKKILIYPFKDNGF